MSDDRKDQDIKVMQRLDGSRVLETALPLESMDAAFDAIARIRNAER